MATALHWLLLGSLSLMIEHSVFWRGAFLIEGREFGWREWWKNTIIYQIYPRSFMDSDGDGIGDLKGITSRLEYFLDIGVGAIWLSPIYRSPFVDFGYDISNFTDIDPIFGTLDDFDELVDHAHDLGIRVILDFVPGYTSDQHPWFVESRKNRDYRNPYRDYFVWKDPKPGCVSSDPRECIPTNWICPFDGPTWTWDETRQQFYYHTFPKEQPDLNYLDPSVREEMKNVIEFWMKRRVDGLRVDAVAFIIEDYYMRDDPPNPNFQPSELATRPQYHSTLNIYSHNHPDHHEIVKSWRREVMEKYSTEPNYRFMMTEAYNTPAVLVDYYGTDDAPEADFPLNFQFMDLHAKDLSGTAIFNLVDEWMQNVPDGKWPNWVVGNHDNYRIGYRWGMEYARAANVLCLLLPGTPTTYYGEELGMDHIKVMFEETQDPWGKNNPCCWEEYSRDPERSPMQWNMDKNAGFSTAEKTWLPVNDNYKMGVNVESEQKDPTSVLSLYKALARIRKQRPAFHTNTMDYGIVSDDIFSFLRRPNPDESDQPSYLVAIHLGKKTIVIGDYVSTIRANGVTINSSEGVVEISSRMDRNGETVNLEALELTLGEALVVRIGKDSPLKTEL
ncbi:alpha-glucosidase-like [Lytechinus pictus]|uniref:alpha-glucosidase-like n=1 Tax=Lytechinus pictus TaxID=7653 RepID=UPI0030BA0176